MPTTTNLELPYPAQIAAGPGPDVPKDLKDLADQIAATVFAQGVHNDRPDDATPGATWYSTDKGTHYLGVGTTWVLLGAVPSLVSPSTGDPLPASPVPGQEVFVFPGTVGGGVCWHLRFTDYGGGFTNWRCVGGNVWTDYHVGLLGTTASAAFVDIDSDNTPKLTVPFDGLYEVSGACGFYGSGGAGSGIAALKFGADATSDTATLAQAAAGAVDLGALSARANLPWQIDGTNTEIKMQYRAYSGTVRVENPTLSIKPIRLLG